MLGSYTTPKHFGLRKNLLLISVTYRVTIQTVVFELTEKTDVEIHCADNEAMISTWSLKNFETA